MFGLNSIKIISGGQSGVDRAALDFAINNKLECGGYCPKGRLAEDGRISEFYPLIETNSSFYKERTRLNVEISDVLLVIFNNKIGSGTELALDIAKKLNKDYYIIRIPSDASQLDKLLKWLFLKEPAIINIAGPRESSDKGIYLHTLNFLQLLYLTQDNT